MVEVKITAKDKTRKVITDKVVIFPGSPGCTCVGKDDLYDLGITPDEVKEGVILETPGLTIEIRN